MVAGAQLTYPAFVFSVLQNFNKIKATSYWTADNVSDGLSALCTTVEMVIFSVYMYAKSKAAVILG